MVTMQLGAPNIFEMSNDRDRTGQLQAKYGINSDMGMFDYAARGDQSRVPGMAGQLDAMAMYRQGAMGQGPPTAAQLAWQQQGQRNTTDALALAARGRGGNVAGQMQQAMAGNAYANQQTNQGMAMLRAQEQQAAQAGYAGMANQLAGQGLSYDSLASQTAANSANNQLGWYSANRGMDLQQNQQSHQQMMDKINMGKEWGQMVAGAVGGGMGGGMMSDDSSKQGIAPTGMAASETVGNINPIAFQYRDGMGPPGQRLGVSAQDLAANPNTASLVSQGPDGLLRVDGAGLGALATAASAEQEQRIRMLEQQLGGQGSLASRPATDPRQTMYLPDEDVSFAARLAAARERRPPSTAPTLGTAAAMDRELALRERGPYDDMSFDAAAASRRNDPFVLSDKRAKKGIASTIHQQKTRGAY